MDHLNFYIGGAWVPPVKPSTRDVINPATEQSIGRISMGSAEDVDRAVQAARKAFDTYSRTTREERIPLLENIIRVFKTKQDELATTISTEVGAPIWLSKAAQAAAGIGHFAQALAVLKTFEFEQPRGRTMVVREPVGVVGMITPWNWPINQIACKV
ncbi:MAG: aldehyde dehydrogenase family protein, partial [Thermoanaerobaculia bacterium]